MASTPARMMPNADRTTIRSGLTFTGTAMVTTATTETAGATVRRTGAASCGVMTKASGASVAIVATTAITVGAGRFRQ